MAAWSQSPFLQALGWAMLNSIWQMALLFLVFSLCQHLFRLSSHNRYYLAIGGLGIGLLWFLYTFSIYYTTGASGNFLAQHQLAPTSHTWDILLSSASMAYLLLLLVPAYRLAKNWRHIEHLKKFGLQKTAMEYRLFVKKVAQSLGIKPTVHVFLSSLVQSPVTIGYLKPIILLPIAAVNRLTPQQVEAVLLHELSHIRRYDYLINFIITLLQTLFYFNPFVKKFVSIIEFEREKCCDELVLQFQYDKISYASALLLLEKNLYASETLVLAAAGKKHLLRRIERIIGLESKSRFGFQQFAGLMASFLVVLFINSLLFVNKEVQLGKTPTFAAFENPLYEFDTQPVATTFSKAHVPAIAPAKAKKKPVAAKQSQKEILISIVPQPENTDPNLHHVTYDATDDMVTPEEKEQIAQTLETTKKVLTKSKWKEVEASIGDGMTVKEKKLAQYEYLKEIEKINWKTLEDHLKTQYENMNWEEINLKLNSAVTELKLDSLQVTYELLLSKIQKTQSDEECKASQQVLVPDASVNELNCLKDNLRSKLDSIQIIRQSKIINF